MELSRSLTLTWFLTFVSLTQCIAQQATEDDRLTAARAYRPSPTMAFLGLFRRSAGPPPGSPTTSAPEALAPSVRAELTRAGLDEREMSVLRGIAVDCMEQVNRLDAQAAELTRVIREAVQARKRPPNAVSLREELQDLEQQREKIVSEAMQQLQTAIGNEAYERLQKMFEPKVFRDEFGRIHSSAAEFNVPEGLNRLAPPQVAADGTVVRQTEFESRLPVAITMATRPADRRAYRLGETIELWITLTNRAETSIRIHPRDVLKHFSLYCRILGVNRPESPGASQRPPFLSLDAARLLEYLPISQKDDRGEFVDLPSQGPIEVAVLRVALEPELPPRAPSFARTTLGAGTYGCTFQRPISVIAEEEETVEIANMALRSNGLTIVVTP